MKNKSLWLAGIFVFAITFVLFSFSLNGKFLDWDDSVNFILNENYRGLSCQNLKWMFTTFHMNHYQPLSWLTYGIDYSVWGMNPFGYHLTAIIIHSLNAFLFFIISFRILRMTDINTDGKDQDKAILPALFAALFFSLHPLRAESVAWITERRDILCGFFVFLSILAYFRYSEDGKRRKFYVFSLFFCLFALLSKSMAMILPPVLLLLDFFPLRRFEMPEKGGISGFFRKNRDILIEKLPFFAIAIVFAAIAYFGAGKPADQPAYYEPSIAKGIYSYGFYLWKTLFPFGLIPVYPMPESWILPDMLSAAAMFSLGTVAWHFRRRNPLFLFVFLYYVITLFPVCGLLNGAPQPASDRYTYLPMLSFAILFGYAVGKMAFSAKKGRTVIYAIFATVPILLSGITFFQQKAWADSESLWLHELEFDKSCDIAWNNLANAQYKKNNPGMALMYITRAMEIRPSYPPYICNTAKIHLAMGNRHEALSLFESALRLDPSRHDAAYGAGQIYFEDGNIAQAEQMFSKAISIYKNHAAALYSMGQLLINEKRYSEADSITENLVELMPGNPDAMVLRAYSLAGLGDIAAARKMCHDVLEISPENKEAAALLRQYTEVSN